MSAGASSQIPLGSIQRSPRPPSWFQGGRFAARGELRGGEGRTRGDGREGNEEGGKGGSWGNSALVVGDRCPWT